MNTSPQDPPVLRVLEAAGEISTQFSPYATYDADGDCVRFFISPDPYYAERIDNLVTVYRSVETDEIIGSLIKDVSRICEKSAEFAIEIVDGKIRLKHIFQAKIQASSGGSMEVRVYEKLAELSQQSNLADEELCIGS